MSKRSRLTALVLALTLSTTACIGPFPATNSVMEWNKGVSDNEWAQEGVFLGFVILPVYGITLLVDAIVLNSIEFWTGEEVIESSAEATIPLEDATLPEHCQASEESCSEAKESCSKE